MGPALSNDGYHSTKIRRSDFEEIRRAGLTSSDFGKEFASVKVKLVIQFLPLLIELLRKIFPEARVHIRHAQVDFLFETDKINRKSLFDPSYFR